MFKARRLDVFYYNPYWIEEICGTPAEILASRDHRRLCRGGLAGIRRKGSVFPESLNVFLVLRNSQIDYKKIV
jgi:hypothetical protein